MGNTREVKPLSQLVLDDAAYLAERIGELHTHALLHEGELCAKLNRARIGGMIEVLNRRGLEVDCNWGAPDKHVRIMTVEDYLKSKAAKEGK